MGELSYLRRAAELGNRDAQFVLGNILVDLNDDKSFILRKSLMRKFFICASNQGSSAASEALGFSFHINNDYSNALKVFHQGVKNGNSISAHFLAKSFNKKPPKRNKLNVSIDLERSKRYEMIEEYLSRNDFLDPKVPDLDEIVPLPPAKLPAWDGKIAFQRWFEGPSPEKPSDELMKKLAEKAGLDWQTGLPLKK